MSTSKMLDHLVTISRDTDATLPLSFPVATRAAPPAPAGPGGRYHESTCRGLQDRVDHAVKVLTHALRPLTERERQVLQILAPGKHKGDIT